MYFVTLCSMKWNRRSSSRCAMFRALPVTKLSMPMTEWPSARSRSQRWLPRNPAAPVTRVFMRGRRNAEHETRRGESRSWPADAGIRPAGRAKLPWIVDVPQVDDRLRRHELRELAEVERPELVPLRRDHEDVGSAGAVVDVARVVELREDGPRVLHGRGVEGADRHPGREEVRNHRERGRFADVVRLGLERKPEDGSGATRK